MISLFSLILLLYVISILFYTFKFDTFNQIEIDDDDVQKTTFSIIIPFRNEEKHLLHLLNTLSQLKYPSDLFEILLVDDESKDESVSTCEDWKSKNPDLNIRILNNQFKTKSPKKSAILTALYQVKNQYVLTTDADCLLPENLLLHYNNVIIKNQSDLIAGPVKIIEDSSFWTKFQVLDMMSLQVIGLGSFKTSDALYCNAANLCYRTKTLKTLNAFQSHGHITSGDDVFTLEAFKQHKKKINAIYHEEAIVWTTPEQNFNALTQQRIRWASKAKYYENTWLKVIGVLVLTTNLILIISLILAFFFRSFLQFYWLWLFKLGIDFFTLYIGNKFFKTNLCLRDYITMLLIYPFVSTYLGLLALKGNYSWKGRDYNV